MNLGKIIYGVTEIPELRKRVLFTALVLAIFRLGAHIPTPGVNTAALQEFFRRAQGTLFGFMDAFSGGALSRLTVFALGVMPYISAAIIMELFTVAFPSLEKLSKEEGEYGRKKINQYTRYMSVGISFIQALGIAIGLQSMKTPQGVPVVPNPGPLFIFVCVSTLVAGSTFLMWLGEKITEKGVGEGISLLIMAGIISGMPNAVIGTIAQFKTGEISLFRLIGISMIILGMTAAMVYVELAERRVPIQYAKRTIGSQSLGGYTSYLPIKLDPANVIPIIFASSVMMFPATIFKFLHTSWSDKIMSFLSPNNTVYFVIYGALIFFFTYFYTAIIINPEDIAENLNKYGGYIPGVRAGRDTVDYLDRIISKLTFAGAVFLTAVAIVPIVIAQRLHFPFFVGGTSLLIVVGVALDTLRRMEAYALNISYEGFLGRRRRRRGGMTR